MPGDGGGSVVRLTQARAGVDPEMHPAYAPPLRPNYSTTRVGLSATGRDTL
jgi:hypothetical protein